MEQVVSTLEDFLEDYSLAHGNSEVVSEEDTGLLYMVIEAPGHTTLSVMFSKEDIEDMDEMADTILTKRVSEVINSFDVDETFNELWSPSFSEHNGFTPRSFINRLEEDEDHFLTTLRKLKVVR